MSPHYVNAAFLPKVLPMDILLTGTFENNQLKLHRFHLGAERQFSFSIGHPCEPACQPYPPNRYTPKPD